MKKVFLGFCSIAIIITVLIMISCGDGAGNGNTNNNNNVNTNGKLTIYGLDLYEGKFIGGVSDDVVMLLALEGISNYTNIGGKIDGGKATLNVWEIDTSLNLKNYSGNDSDIWFAIFIEDSKELTMETMIKSLNITFYNGIGEVEF